MTGNAISNRSIGHYQRPVVFKPGNQIRVSDERAPKSDQVYHTGSQCSLRQFLAETPAPDNAPSELLTNLFDKRIGQIGFLEPGYLLHISEKTLTAQLRKMEQDGIVTRVVYPEVPPRVEYRLTPLGQSLHTIYDALMNWGERYAESKKVLEG